VDGFFSKQKVINRVVLLDISSILPNKLQPRKVFDKAKIEELAQSIAANGLLQPITVRKITENQYELISGERRLTACKYLSMQHIPAIIEQATDEKSAVLSVVENLQRVDLNYFEEAEALQQLIAKWGITQKSLAVRLGKTQSTIANKLRLLKLDESIREILLKEELTERHARALLAVENTAEQLELIRFIAANRLNVEEAEKYIRDKTGGQAKPEKRQIRMMKIKDLRIFFNSVNRAVDIIKAAGINVDACQHENDEYIEYTIKIPKKDAYIKRDEIA